MIGIIINYTPHPIVVRRKSETEDITFPVCGILARVETVETAAGTVEGIPCVTQTQGAVTGLPEPVAGTTLIVSSMVLSASNRDDLVAPDTGSTCIRDESGRIQAVTRFIHRGGGIL